MTMPHRARFVVVLALLALACGGLAPVSAAPAPSIVGTWQVVEWWTRGAKAGDREYPYGRQPSGFYVFDAAGHVFVQVSREGGDRLGPGKWRGLSADDLRQLIERRLAYFGSYAIDATRGVVSEHVESDLARELSGTTRELPFRLDGDRLLLGDGTTWQAVLMRAY
jgi:hypothetical protein